MTNRTIINSPFYDSQYENYNARTSEAIHWLAENGFAIFNSTVEKGVYINSVPSEYIQAIALERLAKIEIDYGVKNKWGKVINEKSARTAYNNPKYEAITSCIIFTKDLQKIKTIRIKEEEENQKKEFHEKMEKIQILIDNGDNYILAIHKTLINPKMTQDTLEGIMKNKSRNDYHDRDFFSIIDKYTPDSVSKILKEKNKPIVESQTNQEKLKETIQTLISSDLSDGDIMLQFCYLHPNGSGKYLINYEYKNITYQILGGDEWTPKQAEGLIKKIKKGKITF